MSFYRRSSYKAHTIEASPYFYPRQDAEILRRAMKGLGTDERAIMDVLSQRVSSERLVIAEEYRKIYDKDLQKHLRSELSGDFRELVTASVIPLPTLLAKDLHTAIRAGDLETIAEILCTVCTKWLHELALAYREMYHKSVDRDLKESAPEEVSRLISDLSRGLRSEDTAVDEASIVADAEAIIAESGRLDNDDSRLNKVLTTRSLPHLRRVLIEHEKNTGHPFEETIRKEFSGPSERAMLAIVSACRYPAEFLAVRFHVAMAGLGTNEIALNRLVLTRAEIDLENVKEAFAIKYKKTLASFVQGDTSGGYKRMLMAYIK